MTDWCTGFPETWNGIDISPCCEEHDLSYEVGAPKLPSDAGLASCFYDKTGDGLVAVVIFLVVAICGIPFYVLAWLKRRRADGMKDKA